ncbi:MAG: RNA polymerase sigma-70 factor [Bacteroidota bacterium]
MAPENPQETVDRGGLPEITLLEKVRRSDVDAFRVLFEHYQPIVFRSILFRTHDSDVSHDVVQETFLRVWEHRSTLQPELSFLALLLRISGNLALDIARGQRTREKLRERIPPPTPSEGDNPEEAFRLTALQDQLERIIFDRLPERCRSVFLLSRIEGKSNQEIADLLAISVRTVEHQINHALKVIKAKLEGR